MNTIPETGKTYTTYYTEIERCICIYKRVGFTPLQVLTEVRQFLSTEDSARCTYAGRLDPMAEGWIHILWSGDADEKDELNKRNKTYEVEVLFGVSTDTGDVLGMTTLVNKDTSHLGDVRAESFAGPFTYPYPAYSSPHIKKVLQGEVVDVKNQEGYIYQIKKIKEVNVSSQDLCVCIIKKLEQCQMDGDFRLDNIRKNWESVLHANVATYKIITFEIMCSSGTYMRTFAEELGSKNNVAALALSITRTLVHRK